MYSPRMQIPSDQIATAARVCLRENPYHVFGAVGCSCDDRVIHLQGRVSSFYFKQVAQESVARVDGVIGVVNDIDVSPEDQLRADRTRRREPCSS
jgi:osmotically-inducible protein OsmY